MPIYTVTDPTTNRTLQLTGDHFPTEEELDDIFSTYYENQRGTTPLVSATSSDWVPDNDYLGLGSEVAKGVGRGFTKGLLSSGAGLAEIADAATDLVGLDDLIDSGDENELIRLANEGKKAIDDSIGVGDKYKDNWLIKFGEGLGSMGSFLVPGGVAGIAGKAASGLKAAKYAAKLTTGAAGAGALADEQVQRINAARARGVDVSDTQQDIATLLGGLVGITESLVPLSILKKIKRFKDPVKNQEAFSAVTSALKAGTAEGLQEVVANIAQTGIQNLVYDENVPYTESLWDDFTVGGASGALLDAVTTGIFKRRSRLTKDVDRERERQFREEEDQQTKELYDRAEAAQIAAQAEMHWLPKEKNTKKSFLRELALWGEQRGIQEQAAKVRFDPQAPYGGREVGIPEAASEYADQLARAAIRGNDVFPESGMFNLVEEKVPGKVQYKVVHSETGEQYGETSDIREFSIHLMSNLNNQLLNRRINKSIIEAMDIAPEAYSPEQAESLYRIGQRLNRPSRYTITSAVLNEAAGTTNGPKSPYREEATIDSLHQEQYGVPPYTHDGKKLYKDLKNLTASQQLNFDRVKRGFKETNEFTLEEVSQVLGDKYSNVFDILIGIREPEVEGLDFGSVGRRLAKSRKEYQDSKRTKEEVRNRLRSKNITSDLKAPEVEYVFEKIVNETDIDKMSPSQRMFLSKELKSFPIIGEPAALPDFRPKPYTRNQYDAVLKHVTDTGEGTLLNIERALVGAGSSERIKTIAASIHKDLKKAGLILDNKGNVSAPVLLPPPPIEEFVPTAEPYKEPVSEEAQQLEKNLKKTLRGAGLNDIRIKVLDVLKEPGHGTITREGEVIFSGDEATLEQGTEGFYRSRTRTIFLALDRVNQSARDSTPQARAAALTDILNHEVIHGVRGLDLWTGKEWALLENLAKKKVVPGTGNVTFYQMMSDPKKSPYPDLNRVAQMEEAVAELIRAGKRDKALFAGKPRTLANRLFEFFERTGNAIRGTGFQSFGDVIEKLDSGEIGSRKRGEIRTLRATESRRGVVPERGIGIERDSALPPQTGADEAAPPPTPVVTTVPTNSALFPQTGAVELADEAIYARKYVGAPKEVASPQKLGALRRAIAGLAEEGEPGKFWYERSGQALLDITGGNRVEAEKLAQAIAITSPQTPVPANFNYALQAYYQHQIGEPIKTGMFPTRMSADLTNVFNGTPWGGRKTNNFYKNVMRVIDPSIEQGVTTDIWMMRAFGFNADVPTDAQYTFVENEVKTLAQRLGWEPQQVQAAVWVAMKARTENRDVKKRTEKISERRGFMRYEMKEDKNGKKKKVRVILNPEKHRSIWLSEAMKYDPTAKEKETAKFDYSDAADNNLVQISWESRPGPSTSHFPEIFEADYPVVQDFHTKISRAFLDDEGHDALARVLGMLSLGDFEAPGYFEGVVSPGTQTEIVAPKKYKAIAGDFKEQTSLDHASEELIKVYAAMRGFLMKQDGVGYHRPFHQKGFSRKDLNAIEVDIGRPFTEAETKELAERLSSVYGHGQYNPIGATTGARLINFKYLDEPNNKFNNEVVKALSDMEFAGLNEAVKVSRFAANEGYISNDWRKNNNGESYIESLTALPPDLQRRVEDIITRIQSRISAVESEFGQKYGWTPNERINERYQGKTVSPLQDKMLESRRPILAQKSTDPPPLSRQTKDQEFGEEAGSGSKHVEAKGPRPLVMPDEPEQAKYSRRYTLDQESIDQPPLSWQTKDQKFIDANWNNRVVYQLADKFIDLKHAEEAINDYRASLGLAPILTKDSAYSGEESISGKIGEEIRLFEDERKDPLAKKIAAYNAIDEIDEFLIFRHAIERNKKMEMRDSSRDAEKKPGSGSLKTGEQLTDSFVKRKMKERYGLDWDDASQTWEGGNQRARELMDIAADVDQIVNETMDRVVIGGLIDKGSADTISNTYNYYTPLRGKAIEDDFAEQIMLGSGLSTRGREALYALGRESASESPLGHVLLSAERGIVRSLKNKEFGEKLYNLVKAHPNDSYWSIIDKDNKEYERKLEYVYMGNDPKKYGTSPKGEGNAEYLRKVVFRPTQASLDSDLIGAKIDGEQVYIRINNPRLRNAIVSMDVGTVDNMISKFGIVNRWLSMVNTTLNPEFVLGNFARDLQTAIYNVIGEQNMSNGKAKDQKLIAKILKDTIPSGGVFWKGMRNWNEKDGTFRGNITGISSQDLADLKEYLGAGAKADWFHSRPPEDQIKTIRSMVEMAQGTMKGNFKKRFKYIMEFIEDANASVENGVRFAAFKESRNQLLDAGIDRSEAVARAASLAKNLTINFNRKGMSGDAANALFLFFNASVQGVSNFARGLNVFSKEGSRIKQGVVASMVGLGALLALRAEEESEEDPETGRSYFSQIPSYVKNRNIVIMADPKLADKTGTSNTYIGKDGKEYQGAQGYYTIPLPYGYNVFHVLGQTFFEISNDHLSVEEGAGNIVETFLSSFSPIGMSVVPTVAQPFKEIWQNKNFFGAPIYRENYPGDPAPTPASHLSMRTTLAPFKVAAETMNALLGEGSEHVSGPLDLSPDVLEHFTEFAFGGMGKFGLRSREALVKWAKDEDVKARDIPFLRRLAGEAEGDQESMVDFFEREIRVGQRVKRYDALRGKERAKYGKDNRAYIQIKGHLDRINKRLRKLRRMRKEAAAWAPLSPDNAIKSAEVVRLIEDRIQDNYNNFNKFYDKKVGRTK